jgi:hypothetical protein
MKTFINSTFKSVIAIVALTLFAFSATAQNGAELLEKSIPVGEFTALDVSGDFEVTLAKGDYNAKITVNKVYADYVEVYVKTGVLHVSFKDKDVPKDVKKEMRGKNAPAQVFRAVIYAPQLKEITLEDNVILTGVDEFTANDFSLKLEDKAQLKNLSVTGTSASVSMKDKSQATLILTVTKDIDLKADGSSVLHATVNGRKLNLNAGGTAKATVDATMESISLDADGRAELSLSGKANSLNVKGQRNMKADLSALPVSEVEANMTGGELTVQVDKVLNVDLSGGAELYYNGSPEMKVRRVMKSTLAPVSEKKK